ncbi:MAG: glycosyltransferase family 4 protein [Azonexaceae bacterium]|nr:glycosyltransferase family 4 protein [Azonexaceae bacterium]
MNLRLLYIDPHPVPDICPESMQILQTVDALAARGAEITLVTPEPNGACRPEDILGRPLHPNVTLKQVDDWRRRWWYPSRSGRRFYRMAADLVRRSTDIDALLVRNLKLAEALLRIHSRPPLVFETHEVFVRTYAEDHPRPTRKEQTKLATLRQREGGVYRGADGIAALTEWLVDDLRDEYGVDTPVAVVPDGVDLKAVADLAIKLTWNDPPDLLYLGSLHPWKGVEHLIKALPKVQSARLVVAGGPSSRVEELRQLAGFHGVVERVVFLGAVAPAERFNTINAADLCLLPLSDTSIGSRYTSPLKLFEYMALGKPVVAADVPALRSIITSHENGVLVPVNDVEQLAEALNVLLADRSAAQRIGDAARLRAQDFSWESRADKLIELVLRVGAGECVESRVR